MNLIKIKEALNNGYTLNDLELRVVYYARVSTENLEQKKSLDNQSTYFEEYIKSNKNWNFIKGYIDFGITGTSDIKRDSFMEMINDAKKGLFDLIITKEISRFSRNTLDSIKYTRKLLEYSVTVLFINDNINTALSDSELRLTIMASLAQDEVRRLSERVKFGMMRSIEKGNILGNDKLYGYKKDKLTNNLKIIEKEAEIVREIFNLYTIKNYSLSKIAKDLTKNNTKTFYVTTLSRIIRNPKYKGYYCAKKSSVVDYMSKKVIKYQEEDWIIYKDNLKVPPIVTEEIWNIANKKLKEQSKSIKPNKYLYSGKIVCSNCQEKFYRRVFRRNNKDITWVCNSYLTKGKKSCNNLNIRESELQEVFIDIIKLLGYDYNNLIKKLISLYKKETKEIDESTNKKKLLLKKEELKNKNIELLKMKLDKVLTEEEFKELRNYYQKEEESINYLLTNFKVKRNYQQLITYLNNSDTYSKAITKTISLILSKIEVERLDTNKVKLKISVKKPCKELKREYSFKRGYDIVNTRRYKIYYEIEVDSNG